jgi:predicted acetyltransferase
MEITVRTIRDAEVASFVKVIENAFGSEMRASDISVFKKKVQLDRMHGAFEGDAFVGTAGVYPFNLRIPGGDIAAAGVTMVGVLPSHRRRGILRRLMRTQIDDIHARGEPIALLWASEESIYQRFGYGLAADHGRISIERSKTAFLNDSGPVGRMRMVTRDDALKILPSVYERIRASTYGMYERTPTWWETHTLFDPEHMRFGASPLFIAVFELDGAPEGYATYSLRPRWADDSTPTGKVEVHEALGTSPTATREVWRYLFGIDLMDKITGSYLPADFPLLRMMLEPRRLRFALSDSLWLRVVDVEKALVARSYAADESVVFDLTDEFCPWNEGRWKLDTGSGSVSPVGDDPGRVLDTTGGALARADAAFRVDRAPWCPENF